MKTKEMTAMAAKPAPITIPIEPVGSIPRYLAGERDRRRALKIIRKYRKPGDCSAWQPDGVK
jgi:hypothetical protein